MVRLRRHAAFTASLLLVVGACAGPAASPPAGTAPPPSSPTSPAASPPGAPAGSEGPTAAPAAAAVPLGTRLLATITVDAKPCAVAFDGSSAWITSYGGGLVDRVDLATNAVTDRIRTGGTPCGIAVGPDGRLWVADLGGQRVVAIDPVTLRVTGQIGQLSASLWDLKAGFGSVWVVDRLHEALLRIDPASTAVVATIPIGPSGGGLAVTTDAVWVADTVDGTIRRVDPTANAATITATIHGGATWFADDGAGHVAVSANTGGQIAVLDATSGAVTSTVGGWVLPRDGTVDGATAWVPDGRAHAVRLVDLATGTLGPAYDLPGGVNPFVAEPFAGDVFVLDYGHTTVWRIRP